MNKTPKIIDDLICDEADCVYMDDNTGCFLREIPGAICPKDMSCLNCAHRQWRVVDEEGNKDYVCGLDGKYIGFLCPRWEFDNGTRT